MESDKNPLDNENPLDDKQEIINAINREGIFFRKAIWQKFEKLDWKCQVESPYSLSKYFEGIDSKSIDLLAEKIDTENRIKLYLVIECKKSYAPKNKWIFFKRDEKYFKAWSFSSPSDGFLDSFHTYQRWEPKISICYDQIILKSSRSDKKSKGEKLQIDNIRGDVTQIYQASAEVSKALYGIISHVSDDFNKIDSDFAKSVLGALCKRYWFFPVVITNATLNVCDFETNKNTLKEGKIDPNKFILKSVPWLIFEYPLPSYLHIQDEHSQPNNSYFVRKLPILFLNSMKIDEFLDFIIWKDSD